MEVLASTLAAARGSVRRPISPTTVGASSVARCSRRPGSTLLYTSAVPEVMTYSLPSGPPSSKMTSPCSKLAGSSNSSSSARSSASRCPKYGTPLKLGVSCILRLLQTAQDRKSTRLNSSHANISYAVFCLKKKNPAPLLEYDSRQHATYAYKSCSCRALNRPRGTTPRGPCSRGRASLLPPELHYSDYIGCPL